MDGTRNLSTCAERIFFRKFVDEEFVDLFLELEVLGLDKEF